MKNISLALNAVMAVAIIILFYLQLSDKPAENTSETVKHEEVPTVSDVEEMIELNTQLYKSIKDYIKQHNELTKYDIIIGESQTRNFVLDFNKNIDITSDVVEGLNKKYNENKQAKK